MKNGEEINNPVLRARFVFYEINKTWISIPPVKSRKVMKDQSVIHQVKQDSLEL